MSLQLAPALASSLDRLARRLRELDAALADPAIAADNRRFRELAREHAEVSDDPAARQVAASQLPAIGSFEKQQFLNREALIALFDKLYR